MIPFCADRVQPLTKLTKKGTEFVWGKEQEASFSDMKDRLTTSNFGVSSGEWGSANLGP